jgi:hypothetical protein
MNKNYSFISVDKRLPKTNGYYLMFDIDIGIDSIKRIYYDSETMWWHSNVLEHDVTITVTHWADLPKLPIGSDITKNSSSIKVRFKE